MRHVSITPARPYSSPTRRPPAPLLPIATPGKVAAPGQPRAGTATAGHRAAWAGRAVLRPSLGRGGWLLRRAMARLGRPGWLAGCSVRVSSSCRAPVPLW